MRLDLSIGQLNRVGKTVEKRLSYLGIETIQDLLFFFPFRYEDFSSTKPIVELIDGEQVTIKGKIELIANKRSPRKRMMITEAVISDDTDQLRVVWFGQPFIAKNLKVGDTVYLSGRVKSDMFGMQMVGPVYEKSISNLEFRTSGDVRGGNNFQKNTHTARIVPIYHVTAGITQKQMRFLMKQVIDLSVGIEEWLPEDILEKADVMPLGEAIRSIHFPENSDEIKHAERRLKFDELFILQLRAELTRQTIKKSRAERLEFKEDQIKEFVSLLPYELTKAQKVSAWEILKDLKKGEPMNRMLEGDVGSGKTVVAAMAMYNTILNNKQAVLLAPTEILAKQHYESLMELLPGQSLAILTRSELLANKCQFTEKSRIKKKEEFLGFLKNGDIEIAIGTHALLSDDVFFKDLGLVIIDEQHRFGVEQRRTIKDKSGNIETTPHFLSMTATPIPRSFALTLYGDLDISIMNEMPKGRKIIKTRVVEPRNRNKAYQFIREQVGYGRQVFVICPLIEVSDDGKVTDVEEKKSVLAEYEKLSKEVFPDLKVGYLHGKMKSKEKNDIMEAFQKREIDILVSTSVIEVGVNIPNASVMVIEGAEMFGLAQLHQFRGRVGRSEHQSYCFLFTDSDAVKAKERLEFFEKNTDGFKLAEYDLETRGPGEVYGRSQSGMMQFKLASMRDVELIKLARELASGIDFSKFSRLRDKVEEWEKSIHLE